MPIKRLLPLTAVGLALTFAGCTLDRPDDPVVLTGANVPALSSVAAGDVVAFRWVNGWTQLPVQVDERKPVNFTQVYNNAHSANFTTTVYADAGTFTGADTNPNVDADDEIAFMARDTGLEAPGDAGVPAGVVAGSGVKLRVRSTLGGTKDALGLPLQAQRRDQPRRGPEVRGLHLQPDVGRLQDHLQARRRAQPRELHHHHAVLLDPLLRPLAPRPADGQGGERHRRGHPRPGQGPARARQLRAQREHLQRRRGRVHRQQERAGPGDPLLHRRQQRPGHPARARVLRAPRGRAHVPPRARGAGAARLLRLLRRRQRDDLQEHEQHRRRHHQRHARLGDGRTAHLGERGRSAGRPLDGAHGGHGHRRARPPPRTTWTTARRPRPVRRRSARATTRRSARAARGAARPPSRTRTRGGPRRTS